MDQRISKIKMELGVADAKGLVHPPYPASDVQYILDRLSDAQAALEEERARIVRGEFTQICSYCGEEMKPPSQWEKLQEHVQKCPKHPLTKANNKIWQMEAELTAARMAECTHCAENTAALEERDKQIASLQTEVSRLYREKVEMGKEIAALKREMQRREDYLDGILT